MLKKIMIASLLAAGFSVQAENNISYSYLEVGYNTLDLDSGSNADGPYFLGSFNLSDQFYLGGSYIRNSANSNDLDRYGLFVGFHTETSERTDFYTELNLGQIDFGNADSDTYGLNLGTRTAFTEKFELISKFGYTEVDDANDGFFNVGLKGLFKFNAQSSITVGVEYLDFDAADFAASVGYRYSF